MIHEWTAAELREAVRLDLNPPIPVLLFRHGDDEGAAAERPAAPSDPQTEH